MRSRRSFLCLSLCVLCVLCGESSSLPRRRSGGISAARRAARHRGRRSPSAAAGSPTPRKSSSTTPASRSRSSKSSTTTHVKVDGRRSPPDCRLGEHAFRVRTATGICELRTFWVGALPVVDEKEPNSDFDKPQPIALNVTVHGVVENEDVDYFVVECKKGQRLSVEVEGDAARRHVLRPLRRDPRRQAVRAGDRRRLAAARRRTAAARS